MFVASWGSPRALQNISVPCAGGSGDNRRASIPGRISCFARSEHFSFLLSADSLLLLRHCTPPPPLSLRLTLPFKYKTHLGPKAFRTNHFNIRNRDSRIKSEVKHSTVLHLKTLSLCHFNVCHHRVLQHVQAAEMGSERSYSHPSPVLPSPCLPPLG